MNGILVRILLLAAAYFVAGKLGLMLAIPPGYATAMFPSSGLALAAVLLWGYRMLPGVFLGSMLMNISIATSGGSELSLLAMINACCIASGASVQAFVGERLVRRFLPDAMHLINEKSIALFMLLVIPLSCMVSATVGVSTLYLSKTIPVDAYFTSWLNWWVGDAIGAVLATPLLLLLFHPAKQQRKRFFTVVIPSLILISISVVLFVQSSQSFLQKTAAAFHEQANATAEQIRFRFEIYVNQLHSLERLYASSNQVDEGEFRRFVSHTFEEYPGLQALEWVPRVSAEQRASYEETMRQRGYEGFHIVERQNGTLVPALPRQEYFPVTYAEPIQQNIKALGYDVASDDVRFAALTRALQTESAAMSAKVTLVQDITRQAGVLVFLPVMTGEERNELRGIVLAVLRMNDLVDAITQSVTREHYLLQVADVTFSGADVLYRDENFDAAKDAGRIEWRETYQIAGRNIEFWFKPSSHFMAMSRTMGAWAVLVAGLVFCSLLMLLLLSITGRTERISKLVEQRTRELRAILDNSVDAVLSFNDRGMIDVVNPAAEALFGYSRSMLEKINITKLIPSLMFEGGSLFILRDEQRHSLIGQSVETLVVSADGGDIDVELGIGEIDLAGQRRYAAIAHDIRERKKVERLKNEFISTVSHELRTPLTSLIGSLGLVAGGVTGHVPNEMKTLVDIGLENASRLQLLINDILDLSKIEAGKLEYHLVPVELNQLIKRSIRLNEHYGKKYSVRFEFSSSLNEAWITGDADRLIQVFSNLLSNGAKFSHADGVVQLKVYRDEGGIIASVQDYGIGISDEYRSRLFDKFSQADSSDTRSIGGTGLGLYITKSIMEAHHGEIWLQSKAGAGTTFFIRLPEYQLNNRVP